MVRYLHDVCAIHIRRNCVHGLPKLRRFDGLDLVLQL